MTTMQPALQAVVDDLATRVEVKYSAVHPGIFDPEGLARAALRVPAILLSTMGLSPIGSGDDGQDYEAHLRLHVITRDALGRLRADSALALVETLCGYIPGRRWDHAAWSDPAPWPDASNLYATEINAKGLALWAVDWNQTIRLPRIR